MFSYSFRLNFRQLTPVPVPQCLAIYFCQISVSPPLFLSVRVSFQSITSWRYRHVTRYVLAGSTIIIVVMRTDSRPDCRPPGCKWPVINSRLRSSAQFASLVQGQLRARPRPLPSTAPPARYLAPCPLPRPMPSTTPPASPPALYPAPALYHTRCRTYLYRH